MKTIIRNTDKLALYTGDHLNLTTEGLRGPGWIDPSLTPDTATALDLTLPDGFSSNEKWQCSEFVKWVHSLPCDATPSRVVEHVLSEGYTLGKVSA